MSVERPDLGAEVYPMCLDVNDLIRYSVIARLIHLIPAVLRCNTAGVQ